MLLFLACAPEPSNTLSDAELVATFEALHAPVYEVYELSGDAHAIHQLLSASFFGEQLTHEYVEHWTTLHNMEREETSIRVKKVDYESVTVLERTPEAVRIDADWSVGGIVTHQAHKHPRVNRYRAVYTLEDTPSGLRITSTRMRNLERIQNVMSMTDEDAFLLDELPEGGGGFMDPLDLLELMDELPEPEDASPEDTAGD
ncbi:MAG: hypothetical protein GY913_04835 [Proteobacteria bacterium]|nr:hypothetical protein [Pseudomonadota bacterium]MCP4916227.1 hypothetical protein [Pseudomonadota bacterium]